MIIMLAILLLAVALVAGLTGYGLALVTAEPLHRAMLERQRIAHAQRLAQLRLHHATQTAIQRLLDQARRGIGGS